MKVSLARCCKVLGLVVLCLVIGAVSLGCASTPPPAPPAAAIKYDIVQGAAITKVTWYMGGTDKNALWIDVAVKNNTGKDTGFMVSIKVNDEPEVGGGAEAAKAVKAGAEGVYKIMTPLATLQPSTIAFKVALP